MEKMRTVTFKPYRDGMGPKFKLELYDPGDHDSAGRWGIAYKLYEGKALIFDSETFGNVYDHCAIDGDEAVRSVMGWLTLKPGDTDQEYFDKYTPEQLAFAESHSESLSMAVDDRFGDRDRSERIRTFLERMNWSWGRGDIERVETYTCIPNVVEDGWVHVKLTSGVDKIKWRITDGVLHFRGHQRKVD